MNKVEFNMLLFSYGIGYLLDGKRTAKIFLGIQLVTILNKNLYEKTTNQYEYPINSTSKYFIKDNNLVQSKYKNKLSF